MQVPACTIPPKIQLGLVTEEGKLLPNDSTLGVQMLALVCALKASNDGPAIADVIPLRGRA